MAPTSIDGNDITGATIDGQEVSEITVDGDVVFTAAPDIPDSGIERYTFDSDDTDGSTVIGVWNGNNGTLSNVTTSASGTADTYDSGQAYSFDGSTSEVDLPNLTAELRSFAFWLRPDNAMDGSGNFIVHQEFGNGNFVVENGGFNSISQRAIGLQGSPVNTETSVADGTSYASGSPHHFVFNWNGSHYDIYHNGNKETVESGAGGHAPLITDQPSFSIGYRRSNSDGYYPGDADDLRYYNKSLTETEISNLYNNGSIN